MGIGRFPLVAEDRNQKYQRDIDAGDGRGVSRAFEAQARRAPIAVHEQPVAAEVEQVGADYGEGDRLDDVYRPQGAAKGGVEEQGEHAPEQGVEEGAEQFHDAWVGADAAQQGDRQSEQQADYRCHTHGDPEALDEGAAAGSLAPKACATRVSMPSSMPVPQMAMGKKSMLPRLPAPMAAAPRRPAMRASTKPIDIQPSSAMASGAARRSMGRISWRKAAIMLWDAPYRRPP